MTRVDYLVAELRCARLRAQLWAVDIEAIIRALEAGMITAEKAVELVDESDALHLLGTARKGASS
jgi:hypothetical protein